MVFGAARKVLGMERELGRWLERRVEGEGNHVLGQRETTGGQGNGRGSQAGIGPPGCLGRSSQFPH